MNTKQAIKKGWRLFFVAAAYILSLPFLGIWAVIKLSRYVRILRRSISPSLICSTCHHPVALVGMWECQCGFTYRGHLLRPCPICHRVPRIVRCFHCHVTTKLT